VNEICFTCLVKQFKQLTFLLNFGYRQSDWSKRVKLLRMLEQIRREMDKLKFSGLEKLEQKLTSS
jgi:hypothetical protein